MSGPVATVLTVYGIETLGNTVVTALAKWLQQYLPFTVLKRNNLCHNDLPGLSCNSTYRLRY